MIRAQYVLSSNIIIIVVINGEAATCVYHKKTIRILFALPPRNNNVFKRKIVQFYIFQNYHIYFVYVCFMIYRFYLKESSRIWLNDL